MKLETSGAPRSAALSDSPVLSAEADVVYVTVPPGYHRPYGELVRFLRQQAPGVWIDWVAAREAYRFGRGRPFPLGRRHSEAAADEKAKIRFSEDGLAAYLILYPPKPQGKRLTEADLARLIRAYGVPAHLVDAQQVRLAFLRRSYQEPVKIATGSSAVDGAAARISWNDGFSTDPAGFLGMAFGGDFQYPTTVLAVVRKGQDVGTLHPPGDGAAGLSVAGTLIPPKRGSDHTSLGTGLELLADGRTIRASQAGHLRISGVGGTAANICPVLVVKGPQELEPWAARVYPGSIIVQGDLEIRFPLTVLGDMEVRGGLVRSGVEVLGSLFVRDGIINSGRSPVRVGGVLSAAFLDRASVMAHTVHLRRYALQSRITASDAIMALGSGVSIAGGQAHAVLRVEAAALGSANSMETEVAVGLPATGATFQALYQSWADTLRQSPASDDDAAKMLTVAAGHWQKECLAVASPDLASDKIRAQKVFSGVTIRVGNAMREIGNACGPVAFGYEKIGDRDRVAMIRQ